MGDPTPQAPSPGHHGDAPKPPARLNFRRAQRLTHAREFEAVFGARMRKGAGPLAVFLKPNDLPKPRLGLSIGRAVGGAVVRARLKRMIREAFRLHQAAIPAREGGSYDVVVTAKAHDPLPLERYAALLLELITQADRDLTRRQKRKDA